MFNFQRFYANINDSDIGIFTAPVAAEVQTSNGCYNIKTNGKGGGSFKIKCHKKCKNVKGGKESAPKIKKNPHPRF